MKIILMTALLYSGMSQISWAEGQVYSLPPPTKIIGVEKPVLLPKPKPKPKPQPSNRCPLNLAGKQVVFGTEPGGKITTVVNIELKPNRAEKYLAHVTAGTNSKFIVQVPCDAIENKPAPAPIRMDNQISAPAESPRCPNGPEKKFVTFGGETRKRLRLPCQHP